MAYRRLSPKQIELRERRPLPAVQPEPGYLVCSLAGEAAGTGVCKCCRQLDNSFCAITKQSPWHQSGSGCCRASAGSAGSVTCGRLAGGICDCVAQPIAFSTQASNISAQPRTTLSFFICDPFDLCSNSALGEQGQAHLLGGISVRGCHGLGVIGA